ncbi:MULTISPECIES: energy-coupling factor ABC transporter ATP-binding protein [Nocardiopsis]|jgi:biotin transport system ATP-binding protein|uniref:ABC transporter ATP-binding protein n=2 Tax=Nocardiopsis alba TaxID=53437 RepID=A0A7K2IWA3_9ACTN|nr:MULTISPECIES: ABC transporter ATP-binding protein [Nocardiopsis]AFR07752.1 ABC transporter family protein [Nocardiopsis alba ATCC BAA-2165]MEC3894307.1 ABC transporter ATP-binding protein [Nocardiopsis sp. LDBS1602]MYR34094.1 ATP-binding cassette domain-containing protein [Nocardiopsis alba]
MLRLEGVSHSYDDRAVLRDVTLDLAEHRIGVIGANGSGKSTLARTLNGLVVPDEGRVSLGEWDTRRHAKHIRRRVGFVFSDAANQIIMPTVVEDVEIGLRSLRLGKAETARRVDEILVRHGLDGHRDHPGHLLSGGQKQLLALASVLVTEPEILVFDEPTTLLDLRNTRMFRRTLAGLEQRVLLFTHDLELLEGFDRVLVMEAGRVAFDGPPADAVPFYLKLMDAADEDGTS